MFKKLLFLLPFYRKLAEENERLQAEVDELCDVIDRDLLPQHSDYLDKFLKRQEGVLKNLNGAIVYGRAERKLSCEQFRKMCGYT